jgi:membrane fusion protein, multidrug efflux system
LQQSEINMSTDITLDTPLPDADVTPGSRRRMLRLALLAAAVLALAVLGVRRWLHGRSHVSTDNAQVDGHITPISPKVQAFVSQVRVEDNQRVREGDTLVVLDQRDLQVRLAQAEADLAAAQAQSGGGGRPGQARAQTDASRATAAGVSASVASAEAEFRRASADLERYRNLAAQKIIAAQQLDQAQAAYAAAGAGLEAARRQAAAAGSQVAASSAAERGADARLAAARSEVENARLQLGYTVITAPAGGIVARRRVEPGELVQVGQSLMSIVPEEDVWVTANLKETQLRDVNVGDPVEFSVDAYSKVTFHGTVESVSPATGARFALLPPDNATGNFTKVVQRVPVRIKVDGPIDEAHPLRPGMSVEVDIETNR